MAAVAVVRPEAPLLSAIVQSMTVPGLAGGRVRAALETGSREAAARDLDRAADGARRGLSAGERARTAGWAERALETIHRDGIHVLLPDDDAYPAALRALGQPPCPVFARGRLSLLKTAMVAVVGTRGATAYGREAAYRIASGIAAAGVTVISGLALGIDGVAHRAAGARRTIGILGCGVDVHYPRQHAELQESIAAEGLLLSELLPGAPPERHNFPRRNRIIAALARGVVVVEAPTRSGALITAKLAADGNNIFAVPGPIGQAQSAGTNDLIRDGAHLVTGAREVLAGLSLPLPPEGFEADLPPQDLEGQGLALWRVLGRDPRHVDEISTRVGLEPHRALASLLALEIRGHARQLPGMRFARC